MWGGKFRTKFYPKSPQSVSVFGQDSNLWVFDSGFVHPMYVDNGG